MRWNNSQKKIEKYKENKARWACNPPPVMMDSLLLVIGLDTKTQAHVERDGRLRDCRCSRR